MSDTTSLRRRISIREPEHEHAFEVPAERLYQALQRTRADWAAACAPWHRDHEPVASWEVVYGASPDLLRAMVKMQFAACLLLARDWNRRAGRLIRGLGDLVSSGAVGWGLPSAASGWFCLLGRR